MTASPRLVVILLVSITFAVAALGCGDNIEGPIEPRTIADHVRVDDRFSTLEAALDDADLLDGLDEPGPFTLFAPTDGAFNAVLVDLGISRSELFALVRFGDFLRYHVHQGAISSAELERVTAITTLEGSEIHVRFGLDGLLLNDGVRIGGDTIVADNGTIHVLDAALVRPLVTTRQRVEQTPDLPLVDATVEMGTGFTTDTVTLDAPGFIHDIQVSIDIEHSRAYDLTVFLVNADTGVFTPLVSRPRSFLRDISTSMADSAALDVVADVSFDDPSGSGEAFPGVAYRPLDPLEFLVGTPVAGEWQLVIIDTFEGETGRLRGWGLDITAGAERPEPAIVFGRATGGASVLARGFKESVNIDLRRVGLSGDLELSGTAGEITATPATLAAADTVGAVTFAIPTTMARGALEVRVAAAGGGVSRIKAVDAEIVSPDADGVELLAHVTLAELGASGFGGNDIWGWTDSQTGKEYALMGTEVGTTFVDLSDPSSPVVLGQLPTQTVASGWRDIKVYDDHAFIVSEAMDHGLQVFDLTQLRGMTAPQTFSPTATLADFGNAHNIAINEDTGFAYVVGSTSGEPGLCDGGLLMIDINTPTSPTTVGCFGGGVPAGQQPGPAFPTDAYIHDVQCVVYNGPDLDYQGSEICISSDGQIANNNNYLAIADVTNKSNPVQVARTSYFGAGYAHQGWLTDDHQYFILNDEFDEFQENSNTKTYVWDVRDLDAPALIGTILNPRDAVGHNTYIKGNLAYQANYTSGLRIVDISDIANGNGTEVAYFDSHPDDDVDDDGIDGAGNAAARCARPERVGVLPHHPDQPGAGCGEAASFTGAWSNYPYFDSGIVVISDMDRGLFVVQPSASLTQ